MAFKEKVFIVTVSYGEVHVREWYADWIKKYAKETLGKDVTVKLVKSGEADRKETKASVAFVVN